MTLAPDDPRHGTRNGYGNLRCRCDACRVAAREYNKAHGYAGYARDLCACGNKKDVRSEKCVACYLADVEAPHGTESRYRSGRCRCGECRRAATAAKRRRREASRVPCSHGCGTLVDGINRRNPDKPPECQPCAMRRVWAEKRAAA
jgi:hypothetical protein